MAYKFILKQILPRRFTEDATLICYRRVLLAHDLKKFMASYFQAKVYFCLFFPKALKEKNQTELLIKDQHCKMMFTSIIFYD